MKIEGYRQISHSEWRMVQKGTTLFVIEQTIDSRGYLHKEIKYFKKES